MATKKKEEVMEEETSTEEAPPRVNRDFGREDLNDLRDAVNELHAK